MSAAASALEAKIKAAVDAADATFVQEEVATFLDRGSLVRGHAAAQRWGANLAKEKIHTVADLAGANVDNADYNKRSLGGSATYARAKLWEFKGQAAKRFDVDIGALPKTPGTNVRRTGGAGRGPRAADSKDVSPAEVAELMKDKERDLGVPTAKRRAAIESGAPGEEVAPDTDEEAEFFTCSF